MRSSDRVGELERRQHTERRKERVKYFDKGEHKLELAWVKQESPERKRKRARKRKKELATTKEKEGGLAEYQI